MPDSPTANARSGDTPKPAPAGIDPRGPRFGAAITAALLAITLLLGTGPAATTLLTVVALLFVLGVARGVQGTLQGLAFRAWVRPRLTPHPSSRTPVPHASPSLSDCWWSGSGCSPPRSVSPPGSRSPRRSHSWRPSSTRRSASAWAASYTCYSDAGAPNTDWRARG